MENGQILMQYRDIGDAGAEQGDSATVGIEDETGRIGLQYSFNTPTLRNDRAIRYVLPPSGFVQGVVRNANDQLPLAGATVRALQGDSVVRQATTGENGQYRLQLPLGTYTLEASAPNYLPETAPVTLSESGQEVTRDWLLRTARAELGASMLEVIIPRGQQRIPDAGVEEHGLGAHGVELARERRGPGAAARLPPAGAEPGA